MERDVQPAGRVADMCKVLSVEARVRILRMLKGRVLCVGALAARLDITQGAVSQHLRILRDADLVTREKRGTYVHYRIDEQTLERWRDTLDELLALDDSEEGDRPCVAKDDAVARKRKN
jgi:DNA-binding transcriptional ArsR family regulator